MKIHSTITLLSICLFAFLISTLTLSAQALDTIPAKSARHFLYKVTPQNTYLLTDLEKGKKYSIQFTSYEDQVACLPTLTNKDFPNRFVEETVTYRAYQMEATSITHILQFDVPCALATKLQDYLFTIICEDCTPTSAVRSQAGITTQSGVDAETLIREEFIGGNCFDVDNITFSGNDAQKGIFRNGGTSINAEGGIILSTGNIRDAKGPNGDAGTSTKFTGGAGDNDLRSLLPPGSSSILDVVKLEFDFTPTVDQVSFEYVFASEEYCEYVGSTFNDVFGFFISGPGINGAKNIAKIPGSNVNVAINSVNYDDTNQYYQTNTPFGASLFGGCTFGEIFSRAKFKDLIEYDGFTTVLTAKADVIPCETYHIKLVIGDVGDRSFDSAVFLKANSFMAGGAATANVNVPDAVEPDASFAFEGCQDASFIFNRTDDDMSEDRIVEFALSDKSTATPGEDYVPIKTTVVIPRGKMFVELPITTIPDMIDEVSESIIIELDQACSCEAKEVEFTIIDPQPFTANLEDVSTCPGGTVNLKPESMGGIAPFTYQWESGATSEVLTTVIEENTSFFVTITDKCGSSDIVMANVTVEEQSATISGTQQICNGERQGAIQVDLTGTGPWDLTYSRDGNVLPVIEGITEKPFILPDSIEGIYEVIQMETAGCIGLGNGSAALAVSEVSMDFSPTNPTCFNTQDGVISTTISGTELRYEWSDGSVEKNLRNVGVGEYVLTVSDSKNCVFSGDTVQLVAPPPIEATIVAAGKVDCYTPTGVSLEVTAEGGTPGYIYNWKEATSNMKTIENIGAGSYTVEVMDANGCALETAFTVAADTTKPTVVVRGKNNLSCKVLETDLSGEGTSEGSNMTYQWLTNDGNFISGDKTLSPAIDAPGNYQLIVTNLENGCQDMGSVEVTANYTKPEIATDQPAILNCQIQQINLNGTVVSPVTNYSTQWTTETGNVLAGDAALRSTIDKPGVYSFIVTDEENGCEASATVNVIQDIEAPVLRMEPTPRLTCEKQQLTIRPEIDLEEDAYTFSWDISTGHTPNGINTTVLEVAHPGVYALTIQNKSNFCTTTEVSNVVMDTLSPFVDAGESFIFTCDKEMTTINARAEIGTNYRYLWDTSNGVIESGVTSLRPSISRSGTYEITVSNAANGCTNTSRVLVEDDPTRPKAIIEPPAKLNCINETIVLDATKSTTGADITYTWQADTGRMGNEDPLRPEVGQAGKYTLTVTHTENNCKGSVDVLVELDTVAPVARIAAPEALNCTKNAVQLDGTGSSKGPDFLYAWNTSNGNILTGNTTLSPTINEPGDYTVLITSNINGCTTTQSLQVEENIPNTMRVAKEDPPCPEDDGQIDISGIEGGVGPYRYSIDGGRQYHDRSEFGQLNPGSYAISVMDANGCVLEDQINITTPREPEVVLESQMLVALGDSVTIQTLTNIPAPEIADVIWTPGAGLSCDDCVQPTVQPYNSTQYTIQLIDINGCEASASINFLVDANPHVFVPTAFSPYNGDGANDRFTVYAKSSSVQRIKTLQVFNRWGDSVFKRDNFAPNDESMGWDGRFKNQKLKPQAFVYFAEIEMIDGRAVMVKGDVALIK